MSFWLRSGMMIRLMPARYAARIFSLMPPTGSTLPRNVISPVIATSLRIGLPVSIDANAVNMVTPADGPSLGIAPAGMCTWMSVLSRKFSSMPSHLALARTNDNAACADSFMTSPSCPVSTSEPLPGMRVASMKRMSPPTGVQASPVATPGSAVRSATSGMNFCGPR